MTTTRRGTPAPSRAASRPAHAAARRPGALYERFERAARQQPYEEALTFLDRNGGASTYTFQRLHDRADELAAALTARSLPDDRPVGILLRSQEDQVLHYLAALRAGLIPAILTPPNRKLDERYYVETMAAVLDRSRFAAVVTDVARLVLTAPTLSPRTFAPTGAARPTANGGTGRRPPASFLQFSSGTTGFKRGVLVSDQAVLAQIDTYASALAIDGDDRIASWLPLYHDMGFIACLNMPLALGVPTVMVDPIDWVSEPAIFSRTVSRYRATLSWNPNFAYAFMGQRTPADADLDLSSLRGLVNCSEPVTRRSQECFAERFVPDGLRTDVFWGCYAMAETTFALTHGTPADPGHLDTIGPTDSTWTRPGGNVSVGRALPGVELRILGADGRTLPEREIGEIAVRSPFNFTGYFNDPEATAAVLRDGWYHTGDLGYRVGDAYYVPGRSKDLLIVGGVNVFPHDIEDLVGASAGVVSGRVSAFSSFDPRRQTERVVVLAESTLEGDEARETLMAVRQRLLAAFQIANFQVHFVPPGWLVKSSSGKMARAANRSKWEDRR